MIGRFCSQTGATNREVRLFGDLFIYDHTYVHLFIFPPSSYSDLQKEHSVLSQSAISHAHPPFNESWSETQTIKLPTSK